MTDTASPAATGYRFTHDFKLRKLTLTNFDGSEQVDLRRIYGEFNIYEDMLDNTLKGDLVLTESLDYIQLLPIIGEETLDIEVALNDQQDDVIKLSFRVYEVSDLQRDETQRTSTYMLSFVSPEYFTDLTTTVNRAYDTKLVSFMADNLYRNYLKSPKTFTIEPTQNLQKLVINGLSPFEAMEFIASRAQSGKNKASNYMFFEDHNGFHFQTIENFLRKDPKETYFYRAQLHTQGLGAKPQDPNVPKNAFTVLSFKVVNKFDILSNFSDGMYASDITIHDIVRKKLITRSYTYNDDFDKLQHIDNEADGSKLKGKRFTSAESSYLTANSSFGITMAGEVDHGTLQHITIREPNIATRRHEEYLLLRNALTAQLSNIVLDIVIPGDTNRVPGDVIEFRIPSAMSTDDAHDGPKEDIYLTGNYIIMSVRHKFSEAGYVAVLQIAKESFNVVPVNSKVSG